ncbi:hypothetical protein, partial [Mesorhizobium sp. B2-6-6]|uniref:hypothetical protein n=1 Tax=Mesorhizobium sp. B2-6-6 TaxID=2589911 RepID=UPI001AEEED3C
MQSKVLDDGKSPDHERAHLNWHVDLSAGSIPGAAGLHGPLAISRQGEFELARRGDPVHLGHD